MYNRVVTKMILKKEDPNKNHLKKGHEKYKTKKKSFKVSLKIKEKKKRKN